MGIKASKQIRSRYIINQKLFSELFYALYDGVDHQENRSIYILKFHSELVTPAFADQCIYQLQDHLYQPIPGAFQLLDMEYDGSDLYLIYHNPNHTLTSLDIYLNQVKDDVDSSEKRYKLLLKISRILYAFEQQQRVFGNFSLNNIFITDTGAVFLGPAKVNVICLEYFYKKLDIFEGCIFLAPESLNEFRLSILSDVYAFGILAYYIVTGAWPYEHHHSISLLKKQWLHGAKECHQVNPKVSDTLNYFILKSIQFDPNNRWHTFGLIIGILEGKEMVKFEKLSNTINREVLDKTSHESQKERSGWSVQWKNGLGGLAIIIIAYIVYTNYFSTRPVVTIPSVINQSFIRAKDQLTAKELIISKVIYQFHSDIPEGHVIRTDPAVGRSIKQGRSINVIVSKGQQAQLVPSLIDKTLEEVAFILKGSSLEIKTVGTQFSATIDAGRVMSQTPLPDQYMFEDGHIQLIISKGIPVTVETIATLTDDFKKIRITFQLDDVADAPLFDVFEVTSPSQSSLIHSEPYDSGTLFQKEFIVHESSDILIRLDQRIIYASSNNDVN
ncbi:MAG: PASTA domain-containing protein [Candidatus Marinamargulisbacteria bacterium]